MQQQGKSFGHRKKENLVTNVIVNKVHDAKKYLKRRSGELRARQFKNVKIIYNDGYAVIDATLRSLSKDGAKIHLNDALHLPDEFTLKTNDGKIEKICICVWREEEYVGIKFIDKTIGLTNVETSMARNLTL